MASRQGRTDPRVVRSQERVLEAALGELAERGYGGFSMNGVATRAGVARSTIYRLGHDRLSLVAAAMETLNVQPRPGPGEHDPRTDVVAIVTHLASAMQSSLMSDCLPAVLDGAERDAGLKELHHRYSTERRTRLVEAITRLKESGQAVGDPERAAEALAGAVFYRRLMTPAPLRTDEVEGLVATVLGEP